MRQNFLHCVALVAFGALAGCGKPAAEAPAPPAAAPAASAEPALTPAAADLLASPRQVAPGIEATPGQALPAPTTEMMLQFEARFGRPPTNYLELQRLQSPATPSGAVPRKF